MSVSSPGPPDEPSQSADGTSPATADRAAPERFLLVACQGGAEQALAAEVAAGRGRLLAGWRRAAWRRGVVTFRRPAFAGDGFDTVPELVFARTCIESLGQVVGDSPRALVEHTLALAGRGPWDDVHAWHRLAGVDPAARDVRAAVREACGLADRSPGVEADGLTRGLGGNAPGQRILDCVVDEADRWWIGWHRVSGAASGWPGGIHPRPLPPEAVSRAWLKLDEALAVFAVTPAAGERAVELGSAPGGACQRLLEAGLDVVGIDPAAMDPRVATHPRFTHWRMRARDVKRRAFRGCDWLVTDMNIDPRSTLDALGRIVTTPGVRPRGIVATLKIPHWSRAEEVPDWLDAFRGWGYEPRARQLSSGGREVCVVAVPGG
jgi:23S rRNA (cytidine2498-2'-O)-methyltransferase